MQDQAGEIVALHLANDVGPASSTKSSSGWDEKLPTTRPALAHRLDEMAVVKSLSASLARAAVELVLASYQARDPKFLP